MAYIPNSCGMVHCRRDMPNTLSMQTTSSVRNNASAKCGVKRNRKISFRNRYAESRKTIT